MGAVICFSIYLGASIAEHGKVQIRIIVLAVPFVFIWIQSLTDQKRFYLLLVGILLIAFQTQKLPFRLSMSELILLGICFIHLPIVQLRAKSISKKEVRLFILIPYCIFAASGFVNGVINGGISIAQQVTLVPLLWMYMAMCLVNSPDAAFKIIRVSVVAVLGCTFVLWFGNLMGFKITESLDQYRSVGESIRFGPFFFIYTPLRFATMNALVVPSAVILLLRSKTLRGRIFYIFCLLLFNFLIFKASGRGAAIGGLFGAVFIASHFFRKNMAKGIIITTGIIFVAVMLSGIFGVTFIERLGLEKNKGRINEIIAARLQTRNLQDRINTLSFTIKNTLENPIGNGFEYLWVNYQIDEAIIYSVLLNGTGIIGFVAYTFMIGHLLLHFIMCFRKRFSEEQTDLAVLGIATLACGLLAGISSESVVWNEINPFIFWAILAACYGGTYTMSQTNQNRNSPKRTLRIQI